MQNIVEAAAGPDLPRTSLAIAVEVLVHGPRSRAGLSQKMGLSPASLTRLVKPLLAAGVLVEAETVRASALGRSSLLLEVVDDYRFVGVKVTSDSAYAVLCDLRARVLGTAVRPLRGRTPAEVVGIVVELVGELSPEGGNGDVDGVGVTLGGKVVAGTVVDSAYLDWSGVDLQTQLTDALGIVAHVENDVVGLTRAEHWFGWGTGYSDFALLTVGAGIGYGLVLRDGMVPIETGPVGHLAIDSGGPLCTTGHRGCLAAYATVASIEAAVSVGHRRPVDFAGVVELVNAGDALATRVVGDAAYALGRAAATIVDITSVRRVILSGEAVGIAALARPSLDAGLREYEQAGADAVDVVIQRADFFEWARGAAVVAIQHVFPRPRRGAPRSSALTGRSPTR